DYYCAFWHSSAYVFF
nr:immunoglobulin light chain junction region [Macaca mulatta]MOW04593.1 immunoglobulin light chain junction region [Macaca mulatta]MOW04681.1 immunoglobulin light chain junction region [Macaca mulatta]MOW05051.1 immunoglobulin light chain junction region [Macaca mulatta]MOW05127.1 immunoglobulin light chain junction region [Macaca mulatta]